MGDREFLADILQAIQVIEDASAEGREAFMQSRVLQSAALYSFIVLGEAASRISDDLKQAYPEVAWRDVIRYRNFVAHAYMHVNARYVWDAMQSDIPRLKQSVASILVDQDGDHEH